MMTRLSLLILLAVCLGIEAEASAADARFVSASPKPGWDVWEVREGESAVTVHVRKDERPLPLVVFAAGSHCLPVFFYTEGPGGRRERGMLPFDIDEARKQADFQLAVVERKNLQSFVVINDVKQSDRCTEEHGGVRKEERARHMAMAAKAFRGLPWVSSVLLAGHSEGADVASGALRFVAQGDVDAIGFFASGGVTQFFDLVMRGRRKGDGAAAQRAFDDLLAMTGDKPPADFEGFPRERFLTFAVDSTPLDELAASKVPLFVALGTRDHNSAPESTDAMVAELLRRDRSRPLHYLVLDGLDHGFNDASGKSFSDRLSACETWADRGTGVRIDRHRARGRRHGFVVGCPGGREGERAPRPFWSAGSVAGRGDGTAEGSMSAARKIWSNVTTDSTVLVPSTQLKRHLLRRCRCLRERYGWRRGGDVSPCARRPLQGDRSGALV